MLELSSDLNGATGTVSVPGYGTCIKSLDIKRSKVTVRMYVRMPITVGVACSVANDVTMRMTS